MAENFDLIFGQNASQQYAWNDTDYQNGWETIGNIPPTAAQFDALQRRSDTKMKELNDELTPLVNADTADSRQPSTAYSVDDIKYSPLLPTGWFLTCTVAGTTSASEIVLPTPIAENDTVTDGTVTWEIHKIGTGNGGDGFAIGDIIMIAGNNTIRDGWLECDGRAVSRTMFPDLFSAIGTTYGAGDGASTFNLPDYNSAERFVQGSSVAGTVKSAGLPNIEGTSRYLFTTGPDLPDGAFSDGATTSSTNDGSVAITFRKLHFSAQDSNSIYGNSNTVQPPALTARFVIKAYDGVTPTPAEADISEMLTELTGKADRDLDNLSTTGEARFAHVVVDSYYDATTGDWWREYADGWIEQGGKFNIAITQTQTLIKPMADAQYSISVNRYLSADAADAYTLYVRAKTTTTFTVNSLGDNCIWTVCGMGAQS
jgi:microcystin-dependent protein